MTDGSTRRRSKNMAGGGTWDRHIWRRQQSSAMAALGGDGGSVMAALGGDGGSVTAALCDPDPWQRRRQRQPRRGLRLGDGGNDNCGKVCAVAT
ncbi:hypothetical protein E2562_024040 [Oryza meyeriana var. granulata]|uniref:DUF834 domain-containing protein n=1 Tax=Oryza meyeriana var. granulata TaxID=110450 RepID=A0A6G1CSK3_9ORYZ|nr:hypothetical protein E2562_024040 [Oryza meyeriana var. granulata]